MDYWGGGGGGKGYVGPPSQIIGGGLAPPGPPSSYAYVRYVLNYAQYSTTFIAAEEDNFFENFSN